MAVAAYAAVVSLVHVLDQIPKMPMLHLDIDRIENLHGKVSFLQDFLELRSQIFHADLEGLARQIAAVAFEAEDIIDCHVVDQLISQTYANESDIDLSFFWKLVGDEGEDIIESHIVDPLHKGFADKSDVGLFFSWKGIDNVIEKIDTIKKELIMIKEEAAIQELVPGVSDPTRSSTPPLGSNNTMVGFDERLDQIIDELTAEKCDLQVLPIVGMGGIGKTTLAKNAFDDSYIRRHFDIRTWSVVSQEYSMQEILQSLLKKLGYSQYKESDEGIAELGERLYQILYDRRYLVVMDDVWSTQVWDDLKSFFPDNSNGSRIMVTTRLSPVAVYLGSQKHYRMDFLEEDKSWDLFCLKAFGEDDRCPPELEEVGKSIAKSCKGLPLAIVVIGGMLSKSNMTQEAWECVANDVNSFANLGDNEHCLKILSLSYNQLPIHLKPCFLYMRNFPKDGEIYVSAIITSWVAEGFLKPIKGKALEEVAKEYLEELNGRNLILTCSLGINGEMTRCRMHDLLRDLCIREFQKEHFYCVPGEIWFNKHYVGTMCSLCSSRAARTRIDLPRVVSSQQTSPARCLVCDGCRTKYPQLNKLRLVKVLDTRCYGEEILHPTRLRILFLHRDFQFVVDGLMHLLWNLQSLDIDCYESIVLPSEIWELPQLRHLRTRIGSAVLPEPPLITEVDRKDSTILLENLQTLSLIENFKWTDNAIDRIHNLKELGIYYDNVSCEGFIEWSYYSLHNLDRLYKLESLFLVTGAPSTLKKNITFPYSLKELILWKCQIPWEEMTIIGLLPNLEVLKLLYDAFKGSDWNPIEGEFLQLKKLTIRENDLEHWGAEKFHFPNLQRLKLDFMTFLGEIPLGIGEIETLRSIWLINCKDSIINSAKRILEEQHSFGNEDLQLYVDKQLVLPASD